MWWYQCACSTLTRGFVKHVRPKHARARALSLATLAAVCGRVAVGTVSVMWINPVLRSQSHSIYSLYTCLIY